MLLLTLTTSGLLFTGRQRDYLALAVTVRSGAGQVRSLHLPPDAIRALFATAGPVE